MKSVLESSKLLKHVKQIAGVESHDSSAKKQAEISQQGPELSITNELCLFDGFKIRIYDEEYLDWLQNKQQVEFFKLKRTIEHECDSVIAYSGVYKHITIKIGYAPKKGWAVDLSGSFHKFSNEGKHNYNDFYWSDFEKVYEEILEIFRFDPNNADLVNMEFGVNILILAQHFNLTVSEIIDCILSLFDRCNVKTHTVTPKRNSYKSKKGNRYIKAYSKTLQYDLLDEIMRFEIGYSRARGINKDLSIRSFSELKNIAVNEQAKHLLYDAFKSLHMYQPGLEQIPEIELLNNPDIPLFVSPSYWCKLKKSDIKAYKAARKVQDMLIRKHSHYHLQEDILVLLHNKLFC
jgi:hypothetical protein